MVIKVPKGEILWVTYSDSKSNPMFVVTSTTLRDWYFLYGVQMDGKLNKIGKAHSPPELEEKYASYLAKCK